ncbi:cytochrome P450 CYP749A22-like [Bidens hawaiensis]|uniref:cytochrome P450 CYP749A22-like n=1 Tax=Bidens hawaiensis TaxID=980011 RepID=UPI00404A97A8
MLCGFNGSVDGLEICSKPNQPFKLQNKVPLLSTEALHHLHIFIFVLAIVHVTFSVLTVIFGGAKIRQWKKWEISIKEDESDSSKVLTFQIFIGLIYDDLQLPSQNSQMLEIMTSSQKRFMGLGKRSEALGWLRTPSHNYRGAAESGLVTTEVISRTAFGSSYVEGKHIFEMEARLTAITVRNVYRLRFPGISLISKTKDEREAEKLEKAIKKSILDIVKKRKENTDEEVDEYGSDYLGQLVKMANDPNESNRITIEHMIDEIKTIYGAGHLTTTSLLSWTVFLLAINQEWQDKLREEVIGLFGQNIPTSDGIARLKTMNMGIHESLRLYPPGANEIWGKDVHCFRPERFVNGVAKATNNNAAAFLPFGMGPRTCVGLNFTTNEAKIALSMILQRYRLTLSDNHVHYPADVYILTPKNGVKVILHPV